MGCAFQGTFQQYSKITLLALRPQSGIKIKILSLWNFSGRKQDTHSRCCALRLDSPVCRVGWSGSPSGRHFSIEVDCKSLQEVILIWACAPQTQTCPFASSHVTESIFCSESKGILSSKIQFASGVWFRLWERHPFTHPFMDVDVLLRAQIHEGV